MIPSLSIGPRTLLKDCRVVAIIQQRTWTNEKARNHVSSSHSTAIFWRSAIHFPAQRVPLFWYTSALEDHTLRSRLPLEKRSMNTIKQGMSPKSDCPCQRCGVAGHHGQPMMTLLSFNH